MRFIAALLLSLAGAAMPAAFAQDLPGRVGRLAFIEGQVSVYQDPDIGWDRGYVNTPITSENSVWTEPRSRAEVRVGGVALRLGGETQLDVARLDDDNIEANIQRGSLDVRVRYMERGDHITFGAPQAIFTVEANGRYRIDVDPEREEARITVFAGRASMETSRGRVPVEPGRMVVVYGEYGEYTVDRAFETGLDRWASVRDRLWVDSTSRRYVSADMTGYEELDRFGAWAQDEDYGVIWYPRVASSWAPFRYGHWGYVRPWGWTWIDDAPWGYAPSHYGRWVYVRNRWGWVPGVERERPVWAPAVVGFIGGSGFSVSISSGSPVGWYPLAPWERYEPWYRTSPAYMTRVNRYVVTDRRPRWYEGRGDEWRHWNRERAATVVNRETFVNRRPVQSSTVRMSPETIRQTTVMPSAQVQQALPQRNEVVRYREANRTNVPAPTMVMRQPTQQQQPGVPQVQQAPVQTQVVRPEFRRRVPPTVAPAPSNQPPQVQAPPLQPQPSAEAAREQVRRQREAQRQQPQQQPQLQPAPMQNPAARSNEPPVVVNPAARSNEQAQRAAEEQARRAAEEQARQQQRTQQEQARQQQRTQQEQARQQQQLQEQQRRAAEEQARAQREAAQQQQQREAVQQQQQREAAQREAQQREAQQRSQQEQQRRAAEEQARQQQREAQQREAQQRDANQRAQQEQARRAAEEQARQQQQQQREAAQRELQQREAAQRAAQEQQRRAAEEQARAQREAQTRAAQEQARMQREAQQEAQRQQQAIEAQRRAAEERARAQAQQQQQQQQRQQGQPPQAVPPQAQPPQAQPPQPAPQANPAARGERRGPPDKDKEKEDKDKEKDKQR